MVNVILITVAQVTELVSNFVTWEYKFPCDYVKGTTQPNRHVTM